MSHAVGVSRKALADELAEQLEGEVRFDETSRALYATDASIYQIMPVGVVLPRHARDLEAAVRIAARHRVPVLPRGSGTGLAGQTVGAAVVLDCTRYMDQILELNAEERWVRVQPGVILDELNAFLKPFGLQFAPDVATSSRASIGGMIGNNSCGARSIRYGKTLDHVQAMRVVLADGSPAEFSALDPEEWERKAAADTLEGRVYREVGRICAEYAPDIEARFPKIMRRVGGYNLDELVRRGSYNLASLVVGSEGTLAIVTEATLRLTPLPRCSALLVSQFADLIAAMEATPEMVRHGPAAVELIDRIILDLTRDNRDLAPARHFLQGEPEALLVTEFHGDTHAELELRVAELQGRMEALGHGYAHTRMFGAAEKKNVWDIRKAGLGLLMGMKGDAKPAGFVEDTAVPVEQIAPYVREFRAVLARHGLDACFYGHASVACLHARPILNLKDPVDLSRMREISAEVAELVLRYGGTISAEHGDGLARSEWQRKMFGDRVYEAFRQVKQAFDPQGILNPGKIVDAPRMDEHLRIHPGYRTIPVETVLDFSRDGGYARSVELCSGVGACRKKVDGTMCPSYRATRDEKHTTRARANILRMALSGQLPPLSAAGSSGMADPRALDVLDLCLECKACKSECPSNVDMAKLKYEFLHQYYERHGYPLRARVFGNIALLNRLGSLLAPVANRLQNATLSRAVMERLLGVDRRRSMPPFASPSFIAWWKRRRPASSPSLGERGEVALFVDTFTNYQEPEVGQAAVRVLEAFGYRVRVPELKCCGRPMISKGLLPQARKRAARNVQALLDPVRAGIPIVGLEPSCVVTFRDEYCEFGLGDAAREIAENTWLLEAFLAERHGQDPNLPFGLQERDVLLHGHCHQKAVLGMTGSLQALRMVAGYRVREIPSGCCGMAGTFGYEREHYDVSVQIGELSLLPAVRDASPEALVVATGTSCRHQIRDLTGRRAVHPVEALALALPETGS